MVKSCDANLKAVYDVQMTKESIRESFENSNFFSYLGFEILEFNEENVLLKLQLNDHLLNVNGTLHGGVHASMLDQVLGMLIKVTTKAPCATINLNVSYLAPTTGGVIFATAKVIQQGYRIVTAEAEIHDEQGTTLAKGIGTFKLFRDAN